MPQSLKSDVLTLGRAVSISGSSGVVLLLAIVAMAAVAIWAAVDSGGSIGLVLGAVLFTLLALFGALRTLPVIGRPILIITQEGVQPAGYGMLPWSAIQGIDLTQIRHRYRNSGHLLTLYVPDLTNRLADAHGLVRLMHSVLRSWRFRTRVMIRLHRTSESAEMIEGLCRDLWQEATGRDFKWRSDFSAAESRLMVEGRFDVLAESRQVRMVWVQLAIPLVLAMMLLILASRIIGLFTNFVASDDWLLWSGAFTAILLFLGYLPLVWRIQSMTRGRRLRTAQKAGLVAALAVSVLLIGPLAWIVVKDVFGDAAARTYGVAEQITVMATKIDSYRRRGCDRRLRGAELGQPICLTHEEYDRLPSQVAVLLSIRRSTAGYHIDTQTIQP